MTTSVELQANLQQRLNQAVQQKNVQLEKINKVQGDLQKLFNKSIKRPRDSVAELDEKIAALERKRTITSIPLAEERQILKEIKKIQKFKVQVDEYNAHDKTVQDTKTQLNGLRDELRVMNEGLDEMESTLSKVKLANKLGCETQELTTITVDCPKDKIGMVIGKNGAMMKQIMELTKVTMDVRKEEEFNSDGKNRKIDITGSSEALAKAVAEIDKIAMAVEEQFVAPEHLINYLTARHTTEVATIKEEYPDIYLDVARSSKMVTIRGMPDRVYTVKTRIMEMDIITKERPLAGRDAIILVGRKGATIERLVAKHHVTIDVDKKDGEELASSAVITGLPDRVETAMKEIEEIMNDNRDVTENIPVTPIFRRIMLADGGKHIKAIQAKVNEEINKDSEDKTNVFLTFEKDRQDKDFPELQVKAKNSIMSVAFELTEKALKEINDLIVTITIDPYIIPRIIGKGGETIKKLTHGKPVFVEVDKVSGKAMVGATDVEQRDNVLKEINDLIASNQLLRIDADPALIKNQFRELNRSKTKAEISALGWLDHDDEKGQFILRGTKENCEKAKEILLAFLAENHFEEVGITEEDLEALLAGGKESMIMKLSTEIGVNLFADRNRHQVVVRGTKDKVRAAVERLNQFMHGGNGHSVTRITVTEQVVGVIIGKGGKTRQALQAKYQGISINVSKTHRVAIRGPEDKVAECRVEVLKMVSSARVNQTIPVTDEQFNTMQKNGTIRRITQAVPAQISVSDGIAKIRGFFYDVRDAVSLLNEQVTGVYETGIELEASQFMRVRTTCRDPSHFERMEAASSAKVALDMATGTIVISGKRSNVRKAKEQVHGFLDFLLPSEFSRLKITKPLHHTVGSGASLAEVSANAGGATVYLDRDISSVVIRSADPEKVRIASRFVQEKITEGEKLAFVFQVEPTEAWLIPAIIGKDGNRVQALQKDSDCRVDVSRESRTVTVTGESEEAVAKVKASLEQIVAKARRECVFVNMPEAAIPAFVGKAGAHIKQFSSTHKVEVQRLKKGAFPFKLTGDETNVETAKKALDEWVTAWEESNGSATLSIDKKDIPVVLGNKGETARSIQEEFGCRVDVDRQALVVTVRNGDGGSREKAIARIKEVIAKARAEAAAAALARAETAARAAAAKAKAEAEEAAKSDGNGSRDRSLSSGSVDLSLDDSPIDRVSEFPSQPVGMEKKKKPKKKKKEVEPDDVIVTGTEAGRNLFQLLIG